MQLQSRDAGARWPRVLAGWGFVIFASAMRIHSCYLIGAVLLPAGIAVSWQVRKEISLVRHFAVAALATVVVFAVMFADRYVYESDPSWKTFREFERPFAKVLNNHRLRMQYLGNDPLNARPDLTPEKLNRHEDALKQIGWNRDDLKLFLLWYSADPKVHSAESLQVLSESLVDPPFSRETQFLVIGAATVFRLAGNQVFVMSLLASALIALLFCAASGKRITMVLWLLTFALMVYVFIAMKLPARVITPAAIAAMFAMLVATLPTWEAERMTASRIQTATLVLALAIGWTVKGAWEDSRTAVEHRSGYTAELAALAKDADAFHVILLPGGFEYLSPLKTHREVDSLRFVFIDGTQRSPTYAASLQAAGITNLSEAILNGDQIRLVGTEPRLTLLKRFLRRHYGVDVEFQMERKGHYLTVNSIRRASSATLR